MSPEPTEPAAAQFKESAEDLNTAGFVQVDVNGPGSMTKAERAAAEALAEIASQTYGGQSFNVEGFADDARAVVAAVRGPMFAELAARVEAGIAAAAEDRAMEIAAVSLETAAADWENQPESVSMKPDVAAWRHRRAAALRTTTPEKEN